MPDKIQIAQREIESVFSTWNGPIVIAYSGGKDSSATLKLVLSAKLSESSREKLKIIYCNTGVENPIVSNFVMRTLNDLTHELNDHGFRDPIEILNPELHRRYFVRVIGRGYPPPTQFFRWCTNDLRIRPVQAYLRKLEKNPLVVVGTRLGESKQRDRFLGRGVRKVRPYIKSQIEAHVGTSLYSPIIDYDLTDVWETLTELSFPKSIDVGQLVNIYREGGGECPTVRDSNDKPCSSARFGCWTCTVVRRDRSAENMIKTGHSQLIAYNQFRNWLVEMRNNPVMRCKQRRSGRYGLGPFTLAARAKLLENLDELAHTLEVELLSPIERQEILKLWDSDKSSFRYRLIEAAGFQ